MKRSTAHGFRHVSLPYRRLLAAALVLAAAGLGTAAGQTYTSFDVPGAAATRAFGLNEQGDVVGRWDDADGNVHGFLLRRGAFTTIDVPGGTFTAPADINVFGAIVGRWDPGDGNSRGFLYWNGRFTTIMYPGSIDTRCRGIDDLGRVTGNFTYESDGLERGFFLDARGYHEVFFPGSDSTDVWDMNVLGYMVGDISNVEGMVSGYDLKKGVFTKIDVPGALHTTLRGVNVQGDIVGFYVLPDENESEHGVLKTKSGMISFDFPGAANTEGFRINSSGEIVGAYTDADGNVHGFRRKPAGR